MSQHEIVEWVCDNCTEPALGAEIPVSNPMPENWVKLTANCDLGYLFELDLCDDCFADVMSALQARQPKTT